MFAGRLTTEAEFGETFLALALCVVPRPIRHRIGQNAFANERNTITLDSPLLVALSEGRKNNGEIEREN